MITYLVSILLYEWKLVRVKCLMPKTLDLVMILYMMTPIEFAEFSEMSFMSVIICLR